MSGKKNDPKKKTDVDGYISAYAKIEKKLEELKKEVESLQKEEDADKKSLEDAYTSINRIE